MPSRSSRLARRARQSGGRRSARSPRSASSAVLDLEGEAAEALEHGVVEGVLVLLARVLVEGRGEVVPKVRQQLRPGFDQVDVIAVTLLSFVARRAIVGTLGGEAV